MKKQLYIVKHEVLALNLAQAARIKVGNIYGIELADDKYQPQTKPKVGFTRKKKKIT